MTASGAVMVVIIIWQVQARLLTAQAVSAAGALPGLPRREAGDRQRLQVRQGMTPYERRPGSTPCNWAKVPECSKELKWAVGVMNQKASGGGSYPTLP